MIPANGKFYSFSIKLRNTMRMRAITIQAVEETIQAPDEVKMSWNPDRHVYQKLIGERWLNVILDESIEMIITAYWDDEE